MRAIKAHRLAPKSILDRRKVPVRKIVPSPVATPQNSFRRRPLPKTISSLEALPISKPTTWITLHEFPSMRPKQIHGYPSTFLRAPLRNDILHRAIQYETNLSRGTGGHTKTRGEVRGSTRKIRQQKGTGMARVGARVAPGRRGGGIVFGPRRRSFATKIQNKVYAMAYRTALSYRFRLSQLIMVTPMFLELPKTKLLKIFLREMLWTKNTGGGVLFVTINERGNLFKASHVLGADVMVKTVREVKVRDLLLMGRVVIEKGALQRLLEKYGVNDGSRPGPIRRDPMKEYERLAKLL